MTNTFKSLFATALGASLLLAAPAAFAATAVAPAAGTVAPAKAKMGHVKHKKVHAKKALRTKMGKRKLTRTKLNKAGKPMALRDAKGRFVSKKGKALTTPANAPKK